MDADDGELSKADLDYLWKPESLKQLINERCGADLKFVGANVGEEVFGELDEARTALLAEIPEHVPRWKFCSCGTKTNDCQDYQGHERYGKSYFEHPPGDLQKVRVVSCQ